MLSKLASIVVLACVAHWACGFQGKPAERLVGVGNVAQFNPYPGKALAAHGIQPMVIGGAGIDGYSVPASQAAKARAVLIADWRAHHYCLTIRLDHSKWKHYDGKVADPMVYDTPYSPAFLKERSDTARRRLMDRGKHGNKPIGRSLF